MDGVGQALQGVVWCGVACFVRAFICAPLPSSPMLCACLHLRTSSPSARVPCTARVRACIVYTYVRAWRMCALVYMCACVAHVCICVHVFVRGACVHLCTCVRAWRGVHLCTCVCVCVCVACVRAWRVSVLGAAYVCLCRRVCV